MPKIILASASPRRRELLQKAGYTFDVVPSKVSEIPNKNLNAEEQILDIAARKARATLDLLQPQQREDVLILSADTEVIFDGQPLGKPQDSEDALRMLRLLSGSRHQVTTAVCILDSRNAQLVSQYETSHVTFRPLSDQEMKDYVATGDPLDKAGAYGIQGSAGRWVEKIEGGSLENIVGLPIALVEKMLRPLLQK